jgi:hypothetical protein
VLPVDVVIIFEGVEDIPLFDKLCFADRRVIAYLALTWSITVKTLIRPGS